MPSAQSDKSSSKLHWRARPAPNTPEICALVKRHWKLAWLAAMKACRGPVHDFDVALSGATYGLWRSAARFDPARGFKFSTYALKACISHARRALLVDGRERVRLGMTPFSVLEKEDDRPLQFAGRGAVVSELIESASRGAALAWLETELAAMKPRHRAVLYSRFVLGKTLQVIGDEIGLTRERVRQIINKRMGELAGA